MNLVNLRLAVLGWGLTLIPSTDKDPTKPLTCTILRHYTVVVPRALLFCAITHEHSVTKSSMKMKYLNFSEKF